MESPSVVNRRESCAVALMQLLRGDVYERVVGCREEGIGTTSRQDQQGWPIHHPPAAADRYAPAQCNN